MSLVHYSEVKAVIKDMFGNSSASIAATSAAAGGRPAAILEQVWDGWLVEDGFCPLSPSNGLETLNVLP